MKKYLPYILIIILAVIWFSNTTKVDAAGTCTNYPQYTTKEACEAVGVGGLWVDGGYQLLAPLPDPNNSGQLITNLDPSKPNGFGTYLNLIIKMFIGICAVLSVVMIVMGGLEYMTSELAHTKESGKQRITHAIFGLLIALGAYALLNTINPDLLENKLDIPAAKITKTSGGGTAAPATQPLTVEKKCSIKSATFSPNGKQAKGWFKDDTRPNITINVTGENCAGKVAEISIVEDDTLGVDDDVSGIDDLEVTFPASNRFTINLKAGETDCEQWPGEGNDCVYFIKIDLVDADNFSTEDKNSIGNLEYDCDGVCDEGWIVEPVKPNTN